jgi:hypothetical protein
MSFKEKLIKSQLKKMGIDVDHPQAVTLKAIRDLVSTSVPSLITPKSMVLFLESQIEKLENEYGA